MSAVRRSQTAATENSPCRRQQVHLDDHPETGGAGAFRARSHLNCAARSQHRCRRRIAPLGREPLAQAAGKVLERRIVRATPPFPPRRQPPPPPHPPPPPPPQFPALAI